MAKLRVLRVGVVVDLQTLSFGSSHISRLSKMQSKQSLSAGNTGFTAATTTSTSSSSSDLLLNDEFNCYGTATDRHRTTYVEAEAEETPLKV